jgi:hypothetical protein
MYRGQLPESIVMGLQLARNSDVARRTVTLLSLSCRLLSSIEASPPRFFLAVTYKVGILFLISFFVVPKMDRSSKYKYIHTYRKKRRFPKIRDADDDKLGPFVTKNSHTQLDVSLLSCGNRDD